MNLLKRKTPHQSAPSSTMLTNGSSACVLEKRSWVGRTHIRDFFSATAGPEKNVWPRCTSGPSMMSGRSHFRHQSVAHCIWRSRVSIMSSRKKRRHRRAQSLGRIARWSRSAPSAASAASCCRGQLPEFRDWPLGSLFLLLRHDLFLLFLFLLLRKFGRVLRGNRGNR